MYKILSRKPLNDNVTQIEVEAPLVANKAKPGQFIILRVDEDGERVPFTIAGVNKSTGAVKIIFQIVGVSTYKLSLLNEGDSILDVVGPLGNPTQLDKYQSVLVVGGGVGCAIALPIAEELHHQNKQVTSIIGFRNKDLVILEDEFLNCSDSLFVMTDDGSYKEKGNVTLPLEQLLKENPNKYDVVITIGPLIMMKFVTLKAKEFNVPVIVSMNPIMIDGTGMCGGCRLSLIKDGQRITKFACIDGPDFDGYLIDFDEAMNRNRQYLEQERKAYDKACNLLNKK